MIKPYDIDVINMQIIGDYDDLLRHLHLMGFFYFFSISMYVTDERCYCCY